MPSPANLPPNHEEATRKMLASLWEQNLPVLRDRIGLLERAVVAAQAGLLTQPLRLETIDIAHKLAGSLGMFGYTMGTEFARNIEQHLEGEGEVDPVKLMQDVAAMRATLSL